MPLLAHAASHVGDPQVRHRGTIGGSIAHADPASDLPGDDAGTRRHLRGAGTERDPRDPRRRLLPGLPRVGAGGRRAAHRDPRPEAHGSRLELPEVQPASAGLGDRRCGGVAPERTLGRRARQHGVDPDPRHAACPARCRRARRWPRQPSRPSPRPSRRPTSTPASSIGPISPRCSCAGRWRKPRTELRPGGACRGPRRAGRNQHPDAFVASGVRKTSRQSPLWRIGRPARSGPGGRDGGMGGRTRAGGGGRRASGGDGLERWATLR